MLMASCPQLQCGHLLVRAVRALHPWTAAISMPPLATFPLLARPSQSYNQNQRGLSLSSGLFWSYKRGPLQVRLTLPAVIFTTGMA